MSSVQDIIVEGLTSYVEKIDDNDAITVGAALFKTVADAYEAVVRPGDTCQLAFPSMVIRPDIRAECFVAILTNSVVVAWRKGSFRKRTEHVVIAKNRITQADWHVSTRASTRGASLFEMVADGATTTFALPRDQTAKTAELIKQALTSVAPEG